MNKPNKDNIALIVSQTEYSEPGANFTRNVMRATARARLRIPALTLAAMAAFCSVSAIVAVYHFADTAAGKFLPSIVYHALYIKSLVFAAADKLLDIVQLFLYSVDLGKLLAKIILSAVTALALTSAINRKTGGVVR